MNAVRRVGVWVHLAVAIGGFTIAFNTSGQAPSNEIRVEMVENVVELSTDRGNRWLRIQPNQVLRIGDRLRTGARSRAALRVSAATVLSFPELTEIEIVPPGTPSLPPGLHIFRGLFSYFHKGKPERVKVTSPSSVAGVDGTEFVMSVDTNNNLTTLAVIDGVVSFGNGTDTPITLTNGERAVVEVGGMPTRIAGFVANNLLQWAFYYPAVLDPRDLGISAEEQQSLRASLGAYREGDLLAALDAYGDRIPASDAERLYRAALLLAVGQVTPASNALLQIEQANPSDRNVRLAGALRQQIAAVKGEKVTTAREPDLTTELLAASYYEQSLARGDETLKRALNFARRAATNSPDFGFAWVRVAELEFSFGRTAKAKEALNKSLALSPRNAQALALNGFLLAAQNKPREAIEWFDRAIAADAALANAWLGRGLCRIRRGDSVGGENDLLIAAALEPRRAQLRSYLAKSLGDSGDTGRALHELELAQERDPKDPTALLYSALLKADQNRINEAISDLEKSQELHNNRSVYRSGLLLDQDRAIRSANLARIYEDAGMVDWSVFEAGRAVSYDYANYSAHLFLANSYDQLRDPNRINLRYETPAEAEYLIANLLAPVGAGVLAQSVSQQEFSKLFERDRLGVASKTEYLSRGAWSEHGAQFGTFRNSSYLFEALYRSDPGQRHNNDFEERELRLHLKQQVTPQDTIYLRVTDYELSGGDLVQYYDQNGANRGLRTSERQDPALVAGYHHEWGPGSHTLFLFGRLQDEFVVNNPAQSTFFIRRAETNGIGIEYAEAMTINQRYRSTLEIYSAELQQIWQTAHHTLIAGTRYQWGDFHTKNLQTDPSFDVQVFFQPQPPGQDFTTGFDRLSVYGYHHWQVAKSLLLVGGVSYDHVTFPENFRSAPILERKETAEQISPKVGLVWTPTEDTVARFTYTRSLSGASVDQSFQIEPTQIAGFNQSFRSIIPESVGGANAGAEFETFGLSLEQKVATRTYVGLSGAILDSSLDRTVGAFRGRSLTNAAADSLQEKIDYQEKTLVLTVNQLIGDEWSLGAHYRLTHADLDDHFPEVVGNARLLDGLRKRQYLEATLQQLSMHAVYNHRVGIFSKIEALWTMQNNSGYGFYHPRNPNIPGSTPNVGSRIPGDQFWQLNAFVGYRFPRRKAEVTVGLLNMTDEDYRLNPLTLYNELPRDRTFVARLRFNF